MGYTYRQLDNGLVVALPRPGSNARVPAFFLSVKKQAHGFPGKQVIRYSLHLAIPALPSKQSGLCFRTPDQVYALIGDH